MTNQVPRWLAHLELLGKTEGFLTFLQISQASIPLPRSDDSRSANNSACRLDPYPHPDSRSSANHFVNQQPVTRKRTCRRRTSVEVWTAIRYCSPGSSGKLALPMALLLWPSPTQGICFDRVLQPGENRFEPEVFSNSPSIEECVKG